VFVSFGDLHDGLVLECVTRRPAPHMLATTHIRTKRASCLGSATCASQAYKEPDVPRRESV